MPFSNNLIQEYVKLGFGVIPIVKETKRPCIGIKGFLTAKPSAGDVAAWQEEFPHANVAIITGRVSGIIVVDVDGPEGKEALKGKYLPVTWIAESGRVGGGWHYYFKLPADAPSIRTQVGFLHHVDIRGELGYVVAPPSIHATGKPYTWVYKDDVEMAELPAWIYEKMRKADKPSTPEPNWVDKALLGVVKGERNDMATRLAGFYLQKGFAEKDVTTLLIGWNQKNEDAASFTDSEIATVVRSIASKEASIQKRNCVPITIEQCRDVFQKWLYYEDPTVIDVALAIVAATYYAGDPVWMMFIGAGSSGKTELMRALAGYKDVVMIEDMTPAVFASGLPKVKGVLEHLVGEKRTFILQDFACILSMGYDDRNKLINQLRQIYNGRRVWEWGSGKKRFEWWGKINMISGCTPDIERTGHNMAELGERFLSFRVPTVSVITRAAMCKKAKEMEGKEIQARNEMADAAHGCLDYAKLHNDFDVVVIDDGISKWLDSLIDITTILRSTVRRDGYRRDIVEYAPQPEGPGRMYKACRVLLKGIAYIRGHKEIDVEDYAIIAKICLDSIPSVRRDVLAAICKDPERGIIAKRVATLSSYHSTENVGYHLGDLVALGVCDRRLAGGADPNDPQNSTVPWSYIIKPEVMRKLENCGLLQII